MNYIRKVGQIETLQKIGSKGPSFVGFYKIEKRGEVSRMNLTMEIPLPISQNQYVIFIALGDAPYKVQKLKMVTVTDTNKINEILPLTEVQLMTMKGMLAMPIDMDKNLPYKQQALAFGYHEDKDFIEHLEAPYQEMKKPEEKSIPRKAETHEEKVPELPKAQSVSKKEVQETEIKPAKEPIPDPIPEPKKDSRTKSQEEKSSHEDTTSDSNKELNTIEFIKKQLEEKRELGKIEELFAKKEHLSPFEVENKEDEWIQIDLSDLVFLPLEAWMLTNNAFLINNYRRYKHLLLCRNLKEGTLKLGIPDVYQFKESLVANLCGFQHFVCCQNTLPKNGEYGYWIIETSL